MRTKSLVSAVSRTCSSKKSAFSLLSMEPKVSTATSPRISAASATRPSASRMPASVLVSRARSTST